MKDSCEILLIFYIYCYMGSNDIHYPFTTIKPVQGS